MGRHAFTSSPRASGALGAAVAVTAAVLALAACSPSPPHPAHAHRATATARPTAKTAATAAAAPTSGTAGTPAPGSSGHAAGSPSQLGSTLAVSDSNGTQLDVTLQKVTDPAGGANAYSKPVSGKHFVAIKLHIQNTAATTYQNNANNETTIVLSGGKTLHADYNPVVGCGNFDNGQIKLKNGAASTGCVTFQVPESQKVTRVSYGNTVFPGITAQWRIS
jgi:Domain of unknown function (DUF4352)